MPIDLALALAWIERAGAMRAWGIEQLVHALFVARVPKAGV
jgi:hypothetical protein